MSLQKAITFTYCNRKFFLKHISNVEEGFNIKQIKAKIITESLKSDDFKEELKNQLRTYFKELKIDGESLLSVFAELHPMILNAKQYKNTLTKYGSAPKFGVWQTDQLLLTNYMQNNGLKEAGMLYLKDNQHRIVVNNPFAIKKLEKIHQEIAEYEKKPFLPPILSDKAKCENCSYKGVCYDEEAIRKILVQNK